MSSVIAYEMGKIGCGFVDQKRKGVALRVENVRDLRRRREHEAAGVWKEALQGEGERCFERGEGVLIEIGRRVPEFIEKEALERKRTEELNVEEDERKRGGGDGARWRRNIFSHFHATLCH
ncbi:hypothetical protein GQ457_16G004570 [Hibiscus cannabinus]